MTGVNDCLSLLGQQKIPACWGSVMSAAQKLETGTHTRNKITVLGAAAQKGVCKQGTNGTFYGSGTIFNQTVPTIFCSVIGPEDLSKSPGRVQKKINPGRFALRSDLLPFFIIPQLHHFTIFGQENTQNMRW